VTITKRTVVAPKSSMCFACNQTFDGNPVAYQFESDLVPEVDRAELAGLMFHQGHLYHYARRRGWTALADAIGRDGAARY
jgi:hypothetical protein